jgi:hypothetical protein
MDQEVTVVGDSGTGWSWNNTAYGSLMGAVDGGDLFSAAALYDDALNPELPPDWYVTVLTWEPQY